MLNPKDVVGQERRYQVQRLLAQGGMSNVYICRRIAPGAPDGVDLVLKEMTVSYRDPEDQRRAVELFDREALLLQSLAHRNLPKVFDRFKEGNRHYFVMEFVEGEDLGRLIARNPGGFSEAKVLDWGIQVATVLYYLHIQKPPVIFRDIKPSNIMISRGVVKLIDFGIARKFDHFKKKDTMRIGSPGYAPPEQYSGQTDARSDIYSFGVTLHQMLCGRDPSETQTPFRLPPLRQLKPSVSAEMEAIVTQATDMDPQKRFKDALEMKRALQALAGVGTGALTTGLPGTAPFGAAPVPSAGGTAARFQAPPTNLAQGRGGSAPASAASSAASGSAPAAAASSAASGSAPASAASSAVSGSAPASAASSARSGSTPAAASPSAPSGSAPAASASSAPSAGAQGKPSPSSQGAVPGPGAGAPGSVSTDPATGSRSAPHAPVRMLKQSRPSGGTWLAGARRLVRNLLFLGLPVAAAGVLWHGGALARIREWPGISQWLGSASPIPVASSTPAPSPTVNETWREARSLIASGQSGQAMDVLATSLERKPADGMARLMWNNALATLGHAEVIRLQVLVPTDAMGQDWVRGLALAQLHVNRGGGIAGHPLVLEPVEYSIDGGTPPVASWTEAAGSGRVLATLAMLPADTLQEAAAAYSAAGIPLVAGGARLRGTVPGASGFAVAQDDVRQALQRAVAQAFPARRVVMVRVGPEVVDLSGSPAPGQAASPSSSPSQASLAPSPKPAAVASPAPSPKPAPAASPAPSPKPAPAASPAPSPKPAAVASPAPSPKPAAVASPAPSPTSAPVASPTASPTSAPAASPAPLKPVVVVDSPDGKVDVDAVTSGHPDLVVVVGDPLRAAHWVATARERGLKKPILTTFGLQVDPSTQGPGLEGAGLAVVTPYLAEDGGLPAERVGLCFAGLYGGAKPGYWAAAGYETLTGVAGVLSLAGGGASTQEWRKCLADPHLRLPSPLGTLGTPPEGSASRPWFLLRLQGTSWTTLKASF